MTPRTPPPAIPPPNLQPPTPGPPATLNTHLKPATPNTPNTHLNPVIRNPPASPQACHPERSAAQPKDPDTLHAATTLRRFLPRASIAALLFAATLPIHAQGCAQCLDTTRATPPSVQAAYRHAIILLGGFGATLFLAGGFLLTRRQP
ncbi:MAG: hypothetical protein HIU91_14075 [Acidobacteria bacterium]|nr:hypothetical protein [Acidobacteriota bacterium]